MDGVEKRAKCCSKNLIKKLAPIVNTDVGVITKLADTEREKEREKERDTGCHQRFLESFPRDAVTPANSYRRIIIIAIKGCYYCRLPPFDCCWCRSAHHRSITVNYHHSTAEHNNN